MCGLALLAATTAAAFETRIYIGTAAHKQKVVMGVFKGVGPHDTFHLDGRYFFSLWVLCSNGRSYLISSYTNVSGPIDSSGHFSQTVTHTVGAGATTASGTVSGSRATIRIQDKGKDDVYGHLLLCQGDTTFHATLGGAGGGGHGGR